MVKFFGVIFLGQPREGALRQAHDAGSVERLGLAWLALGCILLGLFPTTVISLFGIVTRQLGLGALPASDAPWWFLVPIPERQSSYAPLVFLAVIVAVVDWPPQRARALPPARAPCRRLGLRIRRPEQPYAGHGGRLGQPIRHLFEPLFAIVRHLPSPSTSSPGTAWK